MAKLFRKMQIEPTRENYAAIAAIMIPALRTTLETFVEEHGVDAAWFDELSSRLVNDAKGTIIEGFPIEVEAAALKAGVDALQATLDVVRHTRIEKKTD